MAAAQQRALAAGRGLLGLQRSGDRAAAGAPVRGQRAGDRSEAAPERRERPYDDRGTRHRKSGQIGFREFTLEAVDSAGGRRRKTFFVNVNDAATGAPAPSRGLTVSPASVRARRTTVLTVTGQSFDRRTRLRLDGRRLRRVRFGDVKTLSVRVRCLKPGAHTISIRRADGTIESLRRGLTVVGKRCARKGGRRR